MKHKGTKMGKELLLTANEAGESFKDDINSLLGHVFNDVSKFNVGDVTCNKPETSIHISFNKLNVIFNKDTKLVEDHTLHFDDIQPATAKTKELFDAIINTSFQRIYNKIVSELGIKCIGNLYIENCQLKQDGPITTATWFFKSYVEEFDEIIVSVYMEMTALFECNITIDTAN